MLGRRQVLAAAAGALAAPAVARAEDAVGVTGTEIRIGNTMPYSGPNSAYGVIGRTEPSAISMKKNDPPQRTDSISRIAQSSRDMV